MVKVVQRPRWSIWRYEQTYSCDVPPHCRDPLREAAEFYEERGAKNLSIKNGRIHFERGSRPASFFSLRELSFKHEASVEVANNEGGRVLICRYRTFYPYPSFHIPPWRFMNEVQQLDDYLGNPAAQPTRKGWRLSAIHPVYRFLYWCYRIVSGMRYRVGRRLTRAGWMVVIALIASMMMGTDTDNTVVYQALPILIFMLVMAGLFSIFFRARFAATRLLPRFGTVGQPLYYRVMVKNLTAKPQGDLIYMENISDPRPSYNEWKAAAMADNRKIRPFRVSPRRGKRHRLANIKEAAMSPVPPKGEVEVRVELEPLKRGVLKFGGVTLARPDPFGLFRGFVKIPLVQNTLILPKRYPLPRIAMPGTMKYQEGGVAMASNIGRSEDFVSLREYRRGDPYRHIHWRSWAKTGKPIVKEFEDEFFVRHALVLDTFLDDPRSEAFEEAVSVAASFACTLITQESLLDLLFVGPQAYCFTAGRGLAHADQMLEILASVRVCQDESFGKLEHLVVQHGAAVSGCICVLLAWNDERRRLVEKLAGLGVPTMVLLVVEPGMKPDLSREQWDIHVLEAGKIEEGLAKL
jgi:uncharacterized protein (DUF58 family)